MSDGRREDFHESARQFLHCANRAAAFCWDDSDYEQCVTANSTARDALYDELRVATDLTADLVQNTMLKSLRTDRIGVRGTEDEYRKSGLFHSNLRLNTITQSNENQKIVRKLIN